THLARDDVALNVAGAFADDIDQRIPVDAAHGVLGHDARTTQNANGLLADLHGSLRGDELDFGGGGRVQIALIHAPGAVVHHPFGGLDLRGHVRQFVRYGLVVANTFVGDDAIIGIRLRGV